ncbi:MAG: PQQ-binding-like beta-propeller repeat protein [Planctomycetes bacterium]|nr:PQQ-binding-like beta-propeller repeat protein [Planctomycetota bacterium]
MRTRLFVSLVLLAATSFAASADNWPGFRGPAGNGHADGKNVPTQWGEKENVRWRTAVHGKGWSSPVVFGNQVWVTTADEVIDTAPPPKGKGGPPANPVKEVSLYAVGVDRASGKVIHDLKLGVVQKPQYCHPFNSYASSTPYIEDGRLYAHFGSLGTYCVDTATGKTLWERPDFKCDHFRGAASSPVVYGDLLYLIFDGADYQYVAALDKKTGETKWKADRKIKYSTDNGDYKKGYGTPALFTVDGKPWLVCPSAECTIAYDPKTGHELWRATHGGMNESIRPMMANGLLYLNSGHTAKLLALKVGDLRGAVPKEAAAWQVAKDVSVRSSPLVAGDLVFMVSDAGIATCHDAKTGQLVWRERLDGEFSASPVLAGGNVYFCNQTGKTFVVKADREYSLVAENRLADGFMASPAIAGDELFLRTKTHLYSIGKK